MKLNVKCGTAAWNERQGGGRDLSGGMIALHTVRLYRDVSGESKRALTAHANITSHFHARPVSAPDNGHRASVAARPA
jgi:hypothetical protein